MIMNFRPNCRDHFAIVSCQRLQPLKCRKDLEMRTVQVAGHGAKAALEWVEKTLVSKITKIFSVKSWPNIKKYNFL
jgi:hypothetical protein